MVSENLNTENSDYFNAYSGEINLKQFDFEKKINAGAGTIVFGPQACNVGCNVGNNNGIIINGYRRRSRSDSRSEPDSIEDICDFNPDQFYDRVMEGVSGLLNDLGYTGTDTTGTDTTGTDTTGTTGPAPTDTDDTTGTTGGPAPTDADDTTGGPAPTDADDTTGGPAPTDTGSTYSGGTDTDTDSDDGTPRTNRLRRLIEMGERHGLYRKAKKAALIGVALGGLWLGGDYVMDEYVNPWIEGRAAQHQEYVNGQDTTIDDKTKGRGYIASRRTGAASRTDTTTTAAPTDTVRAPAHVYTVPNRQGEYLMATAVRGDNLKGIFGDNWKKAEVMIEGDWKKVSELTEWKDRFKPGMQARLYSPLDKKVEDAERETGTRTITPVPDAPADTAGSTSTTGTTTPVPDAPASSAPADPAGTSGATGTSAAAGTDLFSRGLSLLRGTTSAPADPGVKAPAAPTTAPAESSAPVDTSRTSGTTGTSASAPADLPAPTGATPETKQLYDIVNGIPDALKTEPRRVIQKLSDSLDAMKKSEDLYKTDAQFKSKVDDAYSKVQKRLGQMQVKKYQPVFPDKKAGLPFLPSSARIEAKVEQFYNGAFDPNANHNAQLRSAVYASRFLERLEARTRHKARIERLPALEARKRDLTNRIAELKNQGADYAVPPDRCALNLPMKIIDGVRYGLRNRGKAKSNPNPTPVAARKEDTDVARREDTEVGDAAMPAVARDTEVKNAAEPKIGDEIGSSVEREAPKMEAPKVAKTPRREFFLKRWMGNVYRGVDNGIFRGKLPRGAPKRGTLEATVKAEPVTNMSAEHEARMAEIEKDLKVQKDPAVRAKYIQEMAAMQEAYMTNQAVADRVAANMQAIDNANVEGGAKVERPELVEKPEQPLNFFGRLKRGVTAPVRYAQQCRKRYRAVRAEKAKTQVTKKSVEKVPAVGKAKKLHPIHDDNPTES